MFSTTAYEAMYTYIGLHLHSSFIEMITSQSFFIALLMMIFAVGLFLTVIHFSSNYFPNSLMQKKGATLGAFGKLIACLFLGVSLLQVSTNSAVRDYERNSWANNSYIKTKLPDVKDSYRVSYIFGLITSAAEGVASYLHERVDELFSVTNSQTGAPSYFYKSIVYAGSSSITDPLLRDKINHYTRECLSVILPEITDSFGEDSLDLAYSQNKLDPLLAQYEVTTNQGKVSCLDLKNGVRDHLRSYTREKTGRVPLAPIGNWAAGFNIDVAYENLFLSQTLVNHYLNEHESFLGIHKGSLSPGTTARIFHYLNRVFSWDGLLSLFGQSDKHGAAQTAAKSQEFSENLQRAPHLQGFVKMLLIMIFPWLIFLVVAGNWKVLISWSLIYFSVLLWSVVWTLFYHITTSLALSTETMAAFGKLSDGVSLYGAQLVTSRLYYYYSLYSWAQMLLGPLPTLYLAWNLRPLFGDQRQEAQPSFISDAKSVGSKAINKLN